MGYNPYTDSFEMVVKPSQPQDQHILRCAAHHPQQKLFNLPLSLLNLLNYADRIGCSDAMLKTILIIFLQKHQPLLVDSVDPHSLTTREFLQNVSLTSILLVKNSRPCKHLRSLHAMQVNLFLLLSPTLKPYFHSTFNLILQCHLKKRAD